MLPMLHVLMAGYLHLRMFGAFTLDSILSVAFGRITDVQSGKEDRLSKAVASVFSVGRDKEVIHPLRIIAISSMQLNYI